MILKFIIKEENDQYCITEDYKIIKGSLILDPIIGSVCKDKAAINKALQENMILVVTDSDEIIWINRNDIHMVKFIK